MIKKYVAVCLVGFFCQVHASSGMLNASVHIEQSASAVIEKKIIDEIMDVVQYRGEVTDACKQRVSVIVEEAIKEKISEAISKEIITIVERCKDVDRKDVIQHILQKARKNEWFEEAAMNKVEQNPDRCFEEFCALIHAYNFSDIKNVVAVDRYVQQVVCMKKQQRFSSCIGVSVMALAGLSALYY